MSAELRPDPARAEFWSRFLTGLPSISGSLQEAACAARIVAGLRSAPGLRSDRFSAWTLPVADGAEGLSCVAALARGSGRATVLLTGHFDTVPIDDYGDLKELALEPDALKQGLLRRLRRTAGTAAERRALDDLEKDDFLPGRGLLDMKAGLGAGLSVIEAFLSEPRSHGNLLFVAVPDEEVNSVGARAAAPRLAALAQEHGLEVVAAINLDATADDADGAGGRSVALGTIGKLLPSALVAGLPTHAGYAFNGLGACALAGAIAAEVEWAPELTERSGDEFGSGPTLLGLKDTKTVYNVTTPAHVWMYWNVATHRRAPAAVLETLRALIERALASRIDRWQAHRAAAGWAGELPRVELMTFEALRREVTGADPLAAAGLADYARDLARQGLSLPEQCRLITLRLWEASGRMNPAVILGFASIPYLPTSLAGPGGAALEAAVRHAAAVIGARHGIRLVTPRFFLGISDMSFFGQADEAGVAAIAANTPAWGHGLAWAEGPAFAGIPIVNAGPWGRDYHTVLERLHAPYAFRVLPELVSEICAAVLAGR